MKTKAHGGGVAGFLPCVFYVKKVIQGPVFRIYGLIPNDIALWGFFSETASDTAGVFNYVRCLQTDLKAEKLREVKALLDDGIIDDDDYEKMKREIIG